jgi:hypothetical protein
VAGVGTISFDIMHIRFVKKLTFTGNLYCESFYTVLRPLAGGEGEGAGAAPDEPV